MVMAPLLVVNVNCACTSAGSASNKPSPAISAGRTRLRIEAPPRQVNGFLMCVFMGWTFFNVWFRLFSMRERIWPTVKQCGISGPKAQIILQKAEAGGRRAEIRGQKPKERTLFLNFISFLPLFNAAGKTFGNRKWD